MHYHRSKKVFCHTFHLRPGGRMKSDFSVSLCPFSLTFGHTDTEMETELDNNFCTSINSPKRCSVPFPSEPKTFRAKLTKVLTDLPTLNIDPKKS